MVGDKGLVVKNPAAHHAISAKFPKKIDNKGKTLVVQYEVKLQSEPQTLNCPATLVYISYRWSRVWRRIHEASQGQQGIAIRGILECIAIRDHVRARQMWCNQQGRVSEENCFNMVLTVIRFTSFSSTRILRLVNMRRNISRALQWPRLSNFPPSTL